MRKKKIKHVIKQSAAFSLFYAGILHLFKSIKLRRRAIVLMYHRVLSNELRLNTFSHEGIIVDLETFEKQIRYLKENFNVITIDEFTKRLQQGKSFDKYTCLITFDDGWKDNYVYAYPILKKYKVPATIFLPTNFIENNKQFWQERLTEILINAYYQGKEYEHLQAKYFNLLKKYDLQNILNIPENKLRPSINKIISTTKNKTPVQIERMINEISEIIDIKRTNEESNKTFLNWAEVKQMKEDGISFGSHGMTHNILTKVPFSEAEYEIVESKRLIEKVIEGEISSISYPNGEYQSGIIDIVKSHGYRTAFSTDKGFVNASDNPFSLKRINIHTDVTNNIPMFLSNIIGVF